MKTTLRIMLSFILGAAAGAAAGYLTSPRTGRKNREKLAKDVDVWKRSLEEAANRKMEEAKSILNEEVKKGAVKGKKMIDRMREAMTMA